MRALHILIAGGLAITSASAFAQQAAAPAPAAATAAAPYTTAATELGTLLDNPEAKAVLEKALPGMTTNPQIDMARGMTLKSMQQFVPDQLTDAKLAEIDAELAKVKHP